MGHIRALAGAAGALILGLATTAPGAWAQGVSADKIVFGQSAALGGPAAALGTGMRDGIQAAFAEANRAGGVGGRKLDLVSLDDGYEPNKAIEATQKLINETGVFALIGPVGTPTSAAVLPMVTEKQVPYIGAFTGAEVLRHPYNKWVVNIRASYFQETESMVERLTKDLGVTKIAIFYQDDAYGRAGLAGVQRALQKRSMTLVGEGTYERNTTAVRTGLLAIRKTEPQAVIMIGTYKPCAEFIKLAKQLKQPWRFVNISFVGSDALAAELSDQGDGVIVTQVVPLPSDETIPVVRRYHAALKELSGDHKPGFVSLEGYLAGRATLAVLQKVDGAPTRKHFIDAVVKSGPFDLGGLTLSYGPDKNQGIDTVYLTVLHADGKYQAVASLK
jgi:ABC-type branched-subunit amino acid transport system substrate-binding protein